MTDPKQKATSMAVQGREDIDDMAKPSNYWKTNLGPGVYDTTQHDLNRSLQEKMKQNYSTRITEDIPKEKSSLTYVGRLNMSQTSTSPIKKMRMPRHFKRMFQQFTTEQRGVEEDSVRFQQLNRDLGNSINLESRLIIEAKGTPEHIGPGTYDIETEAIVRKLQDWMERKQSYCLRNHYQNYIFPVKDDTRESFFNESVAEQLHLSSQIKHKRFLSQSLNESQIGKQNESQSDYVKSKIAKLGSLYEKIKLRDTINKSRLSPSYREYRPAAMPTQEAISCRER